MRGYTREMGVEVGEGALAGKEGGRSEGETGFDPFVGLVDGLSGRLWDLVLVADGESRRAVLLQALIAHRSERCLSAMFSTAHLVASANWTVGRIRKALGERGVAETSS